MYNLARISQIQKKFTLLNSGDYLMNINEVEEIIKASKKYLKHWKQIEIDDYNEKLLAQREKEIKDTSKYRELVKRQKLEREEKRFLYIIHNKRNGLYKIGISINPAFRERTLQSEEPEIEIIETFKGGFELEKQIHSFFAGKRIRGEWFKLNDEDILNLKNDFIIR